MLHSQAQTLLTNMLGPGAEFRDGQWEAIRIAVEERDRLLVVQRTGWGKSLVYFMTTRFLRDRGMGPTLLISPLLSLMRNQIEMAERLQIRATSMNSANALEGFSIVGICPPGPVLLVDDIVDSRWTMTVCGVLLRENGSGPVYPLALASSAGGGDPD